VHRLFEEKNKKVIGASIDSLYYSIISEMVDTYEQLLTAIELTITDFEQRTLYRPTRKMLEYLDTLSRQIIVLRRHFWHIRDILNFLIHAQKEQSEKVGETKYIEMAYDNITQLIQLVESYRDTINSTRDLYMANISLQMNDTMRVLAVFSAIVLPLTFISGIYGMNGLDLHNISSVPLGFAIVILTMLIAVGILFLFFKKKQWILTKRDDDELLTNKELHKQKS
jgi:magnesium transporter